MNRTSASYEVRRERRTKTRTSLSVPGTTFPLPPELFWVSGVTLPGRFSSHALAVSAFGFPSFFFPDTPTILKGQLDRFNPDTVRQGSTLDKSLTSLDDGESIQMSSELRIELLRHWNLYDAMSNSSSLCTYFASWSQGGKRHLLEFLATLGVSIREAQQKWQHMSTDLRRAVEGSEMSTAIDRFHLDDLRYDSFIKTKGKYKVTVSAADIVLAVTATLELGDGSAVEGPDSLQRRFWRAYDLLGGRLGDRNVREGFEVAISTQSFLVQLGGRVLEQRMFVSAGPFRYVFLRDGQSRDAMCHPLVLSRLALFLMHAVEQQGGKPKPFVVLTPIEANGELHRSHDREREKDRETEELNASIAVPFHFFFFFPLFRPFLFGVDDRNVAGSCSEPERIQRLWHAVPSGCRTNWIQDFLRCVQLCGSGGG